MKIKEKLKKNQVKIERKPNENEMSNSIETGNLIEIAEEN